MSALYDRKPYPNILHLAIELRDVSPKYSERRRQFIKNPYGDLHGLLCSIRCPSLESLAIRGEHPIDEFKWAYFESRWIERRCEDPDKARDDFGVDWLGEFFDDMEPGTLKKLEFAELPIVNGGEIGYVLSSYDIGREQRRTVFDKVEEVVLKDTNQAESPIFSPGLFREFEKKRFPSLQRLHIRTFHVSDDWVDALVALVQERKTYLSILLEYAGDEEDLPESFLDDLKTRCTEVLVKCVELEDA